MTEKINFDDAVFEGLDGDIEEGPRKGPEVSRQSLLALNLEIGQCIVCNDRANAERAARYARVKKGYNCRCVKFQKGPFKGRYGVFRLPPGLSVYQWRLKKRFG